MRKDCFCVNAMENKIIQSPLNYTGGKYKLLPQILPLFPKNINTFVDLFCGGCNVGINADCKQVTFNDYNHELMDLYSTFQRLDMESILRYIYEIIEDYNLSLTSKYGYSYYKCESAEGLANYNRVGFLKLRDDFNKSILKQKTSDFYYIMLYVLIVYSFNNQIRFNSKGEFNLPVGKRDFNEKMKRKLIDFVDTIKKQNCHFTCQDFRKLDISCLTSNDFVYIDPPYLITCATYNEMNAWNDENEKALLKFLDELNEKNIRFALSNVLRSKGKENVILIEWLNKNFDKYNTIRLKYNYKNSNYQTKDKKSLSEEVLIINY